jgi:glycosyltransferase involved in cell wall biosynthesis
VNNDPRGQTLAASSRAAAEPATSRVIVIVPCRNEQASVAKVVREFLALPHVDQILVVDNASTDQTAETARAAGARVILESRPGKGYALLTGVREAGDADYYVMVDGDDTYPSDQLPELLAAAERGADMVIGTRLQSPETGALRPGHTLGNRLFIQLVRLLFGLKTRDLFSGYRVMSRRYVQAAPLIATGFEIELELSLQALTHGFQIAELPVSYRPRPEGSASKLRTFHDGLRILRSLFLFFRDYRPMTFFGTLSLILLAFSLTGGAVVILGFLKTGLVPRLPLAVLSAALFLLSALSLACGVLLSSINRRTAEIAALVRKRAARL